MLRPSMQELAKQLCRGERQAHPVHTASQHQQDVTEQPNQLHRISMPAAITPEWRGPTMELIRPAEPRFMVGGLVSGFSREEDDAETQTPSRLGISDQSITLMSS